MKYFSFVKRKKKAVLKQNSEKTLGAHLTTERLLSHTIPVVVQIIFFRNSFINLTYERLLSGVNKQISHYMRFLRKNLYCKPYNWNVYLQFLFLLVGTVKRSRREKLVSIKMSKPTVHSTTVLTYKGINLIVYQGKKNKNVL